MTTVASSGGVDNGRQFESAMSMIDDSQLVEQLVRSDVVSKKDLRRGLDLAKERGKGLYETLIAAELVDERTLIKSVGKVLNVRPVWLGDRTPDAEVTDRVPRSLAVRNNVLPLKFESGGDSESLVLAMADPLDVLAMDEIASHAGVDVRPVLAGLGDLARALERVYGPDDLDDARNASSLDALEQAASGEGAAFGDDLVGDSSSAIDLAGSELDASDLADDVVTDGLDDDSWATFFDEAEDVDYTEDSAVISRDMQDRAISSILDAVDSESEEDSDEEDSLKSLDEPLSRSQITGGIEPDLGAWEVDGALDGQQSKDYAKIGHLFVYSPEKAAAHSEAEVVEEDGDGEENEEKKAKSEKEKEKKKEKEPARPESDGPDESQTSVEESSNDKSKGAELGNEPSAAIINPLKKLKPKAKSAAEVGAADQPALDDDSEGEDTPDDKTSIGGGFFGAGDQADESQPSSSPSLQLSEESESEVEDDDDDTSNNTAFGFGPASLLSDESESEPEASEPEFAEPTSAVESESAQSESAQSEPLENEPIAAKSLQQTFVTRLAELADLDAESQRLIQDASADDLIYAVVLALAQTDVLDARDLIEYIGKK